MKLFPFSSTCGTSPSLQIVLSWERGCTLLLSAPSTGDGGESTGKGMHSRNQAAGLHLVSGQGSDCPGPNASPYLLVGLQAGEGWPEPSMAGKA